MELIAGIPFIGGFLANVLPFVVVLGIVVFVHEYGHYIVARWCGIRSEVFSIGFGPVLWSRRDRRGTLWQVAALPLGGYVKFFGDSDGSSRADAAQMNGMTAARARRELSRRQRGAADAHGAGRAGLQLPADDRGLHRSGALAGRADRPADAGRDRAAAGGRAAAAPGRRRARGQRRAGGGVQRHLHGRDGDAGAGPDALRRRARRRAGDRRRALRACRRWCRASSRCRRRARPDCGRAT